MTNKLVWLIIGLAIGLTFNFVTVITGLYLLPRILSFTSVAIVALIQLGIFLIKQEARSRKIENCIMAILYYCGAIVGITALFDIFVGI